MHDPDTLAFSIRRPWPDRGVWNGKRWRHWPSLVEVWHHDPETDGSDDSCGWSRAPLTPADRKLVEDMVDWERQHPYLATPAIRSQGVVVDRRYEYLQLPPGQTLGYVAGVWLQVAWQKDRRRTLDAGELTAIIALACNPLDNLGSVMLGERTPLDGARRLIVCVVRAYLTHHRPWWRHPRFHVHHWRISVVPWVRLRRAFERCARCGKRIGYTSSVVGAGSYLDRRTGRRKDRLFHDGCSYVGVRGVAWDPESQKEDAA